MDIHAMNINAKGNVVTVAFHIQVPDEDTAAGVNLRTAVIESGLSEGTSINPRTSVGELAQIAAGEVLEIVEGVQFDKNWTNAVKLAKIAERHAVFESAGRDRLRSQLKFWGYAADV